MREVAMWQNDLRREAYGEIVATYPKKAANVIEGR